MKNSMIFMRSRLIRFLNIKVVLALLVLTPFLSCTNSKSKESGSEFGGVKIGIITYSWRSLPGSAQDIIRYCKESGISNLELMGNVVEEFAGIPGLPRRPKPADQMTEEEKVAHDEAYEKARESQVEWRLNAPMEKFSQLRQMFDSAGINIHIVKFSPSNWTDEEIDYAFEAAKIMGAKGVSNEIGHEACERLGKFAEKHEMYAIFHNHGQPGDPEFSFDDFLEYSPNNMLNLDVGHYFGATGKHPNALIERLHDRIFSIHMKDKTGKDSEPSNTNQVWGQGKLPLETFLNLFRRTIGLFIAILS